MENIAAENARAAHTSNRAAIANTSADDPNNGVPTAGHITAT